MTEFSFVSLFLYVHTGWSVCVMMQCHTQCELTLQFFQPCGIETWYVSNLDIQVPFLCTIVLIVHLSCLCGALCIEERGIKMAKVSCVFLIVALLFCSGENLSLFRVQLIT